jgi:hypothetical protein
MSAVRISSWSARTLSVCLLWTLCVFVALHVGGRASSILLVIGVGLVLAGARWVVESMPRTTMWKRLAGYVAMTILFVLGFIIIFYICAFGLGWLPGN